jgi:catechol 2,3-dioxygenase-like lactoylglutathione lyase family enzyme
MNISGIDHIVIRVHELEPMVKFYCEALGCSIERRLDESGLVQLRAGRSLIDLATVAGSIGSEGGVAPGREGHNVAHFCLIIDPFESEAITEHMRSFRVEPKGLRPRYGAEGIGLSLFIKDPEGNTIELKAPSVPRQSALFLRSDANSTYPPHNHPGREEISNSITRGTIAS